MSTTEILEHLAALVGFDTQDPPREVHGDSGIVRYCREVLAGFDVQLRDHGKGRVSLFAVRGRPAFLFNVHLDTVPAGPGWDSDPLTLKVAGNTAVGRGACDVKGAAACLLALAASQPDNMAVLFTTDEEGSDGCCVRRFLESGGGEPFRQAIVAEPTSCRAVLGHRGFLSVEGVFQGSPGHSSEARALKDNAIHQMTLWAAAALELAAGMTHSADDPGACFNIGIVRGGTAENVIAGEARVHWSARLRPGSSNEAYYEQVKACVPPGASVEWRPRFGGEPLPAAGQGNGGAREFAGKLALPVGNDVDFWTEAAIFSEFGLPALVLGPGNIAQAHVANEWVELAQLERACDLYRQVIMIDG